MSDTKIEGKAYVLGDNIDTDQIIPAEHLYLVPTNPDEYEKLGSYALSGLPDKISERYVKKDKFKTEYPIIISSRNFGCGSSREHAPISLGAAGCKAVVSSSFARIFFRNSVATGEIYPLESAEDLSSEINTGDYVSIDLEKLTLTSEASGTSYSLKPLGDVKDVVNAGGIFNYARKTNMI